MELDRRIITLLIVLSASYAVAPAIGQDTIQVDSTVSRDLTGQMTGVFNADMAADRLRILITHPDSVRAHMSEAVTLYVNLLYNADLVGAEAHDTIVTTLLQAFSIVAPAEIVASLITGERRRGVHLPHGSAPTARDGAGPRLVAWWRRSDPLPATESNELVEEHLIRLAHALDAYSGEKWPGGFDARGEIWLRYGEPSKMIEIEFSDPVLMDIVFRPGVAVSPSDFPKNEFWVYGHIDRAAYFLFVHEGDGFRLGDSHDLIPRTLRSGYSSYQRGRIKSGMAIAAMQNIYRQLAALHSDFATRFAEVDHYAMRLPEFGTGRMAIRQGRPLSTAPENIDDGSTGVTTPDVFAATMLVRTQSEDEAADALRAEVVPIVFFESEHLRPRLRVSYRVIRRLVDRGRTVVDIYWAPEPGGLSVNDEVRAVAEIGDPDRFMLSFTSVAKGLLYATRLVQIDHLIVDMPVPRRGDDDSQPGILVPTQLMRVAPTEKSGIEQTGERDHQGNETMSFSPSGNELHLALQWDQFAMIEEGENSEVGPLLRTFTELVDSLDALQANELTLEMSDILPLSSDIGGDTFIDRATPYPFNRLTEGLHLALSFDIYHLAFSVDDRTHYRVRFIVRRGTRKDGRFSPSGGRESGTSVAFVRSGESRTANEVIEVDLGGWSGRGQLEITVEVTDQLDGRMVSRKIEFELHR